MSVSRYTAKNTKCQNCTKVASGGGSGGRGCAIKVKKRCGPKVPYRLYTFIVQSRPPDPLRTQLSHIFNICILEWPTWGSGQLQPWGGFTKVFIAELVVCLSFRPQARLSYLTVYKFRVVVETRRNRARIGPESFGIVVCRFVATVPDIVGLVWPSFGPNPVRNRRFPAGSLNVLGAFLAWPSCFRQGPGGPRERAVTRPLARKSRLIHPGRGGAQK